MTTDSESSNTGAIAGGVIAGVVIAAIVAFSCLVIVVVAVVLLVLGGAGTSLNAKRFMNKPKPN